MLLIILLIILLGYLWWHNSLPDKSSVEPFTNNTRPLELDIHTFDKFYAGRRNQINNARLERARDNEFVTVFLLVSDASNKGKRYISYKDLPNSPKMYRAFSLLLENPDTFFSELVILSLSDRKPVYAVDPTSKENNNNLGLQIELEPQRTTQYNPRTPTSMWKYVERSRNH